MSLPLAARFYELVLYSLVLCPRHLHFPINGEVEGSPEEQQPSGEEHAALRREPVPPDSPSKFPTFDYSMPVTIENPIFYLLPPAVGRNVSVERPAALRLTSAPCSWPARSTRWTSFLRASPCPRCLLRGSSHLWIIAPVSGSFTTSRY